MPAHSAATTPQRILMDELAPPPPIRVVIPCYEEADRLDVAAFDRFLASTIGIHLVLVNDGSKDATLDILEGIRKRWPEQVRVIDQQPNQGKAEAVRVGILDALSAGSSYVGYWDADLATPLEVIEEAAQVMARYEDIQIVLGARVALLGRQIDRKLSRHYAGRIFATAASVTLGLPVYDTQCGAKLIRVSEHTEGLFREGFISRWIFDVELLARYLKHDEEAAGLYELPLKKWTDIGESKVRPTDFVRAAGEMAQIYRRYSSARPARLLRWLLSPLGRYAMAGGLGTLSHYAVLAGLVEVGSVSPTVATTFGAMTGAVVNYWLNYLFVFGSSKSHLETVPKFSAVALLGAATNASGMWLLNETQGMHYAVSQIVCTLVVLLLGFTLNRLWTFSSKA